MQQLLPPLSDEEYAALKADITKRGRNLVPIVKDADTGETVDGFHRERICQELGIEAVVVKWKFKDEGERHEIALLLNLLRRQLGPISWAEAFERLAETRGISSTGKHQEVSYAKLAQEVGVKPRTAHRRRRHGQRRRSRHVHRSLMDRRGTELGCPNKP